MKGKKIAALFFAVLTLLLLPQRVWAAGEGNMEGGGGGMGSGSGASWWNPGDDGVRITVVDAETGAIQATPQDFSNISPGSILHFGKVSKLSYKSGTPLSIRSGSDYHYRTPARRIPTIVTSNGGSNITAIKQYFCSEYAVQMVADASGIPYDTLICGDYKLVVEPLAYFTFRGNKYCMTATEAALYDQKCNGDLWDDMNSLTHKNLPLSIFLEYSDLGFPAWTGSRSERTSNANIISSLGIGIVKFADQRVEVDEPADFEYRVDTDVVTSITLHSGRNLTPSNPASVTFHIGGRSYQVNNIVIPAGDSQVVWVKWHTPSTPQTLDIRADVTRGSTSQTHIRARIVDLDDNPPPDPKATDTNPGYAVPVLPTNSQRSSASWGVWSCYWVPPIYPEEDDEEEEEIPGYWAYRYSWYSASISGDMTLMPDDIVPTAVGKTMKSGYGVKINASGVLSTSAPTSHYSMAQTALSTFPEFNYQTYSRLLQGSGGMNYSFVFKPNEYSTLGRGVHFTPIWFPDGKRYTVYTRVWDAWTPAGMLSVNLSDYVNIQGNMFDDWYSARE